MKIVFINNKCHLTGADAALKNRIEFLQQLNTECSIVFLEHGMEEETFKGLNYIVADTQDKLNKAIVDCDAVVTVILQLNLMKQLSGSGKPLIYECHACGPYTYLEKLAQYGVSGVLFPSKACYEEAKSYIPDGVKAFVVPNCPPYGEQEIMALTDSTAIPLLWVGRLEPNKNWMPLVNIAPKLKKDYIIRVITDVSFDRDYSKFIDIIKKENLEDRFDIVTNCPYSEMQRWYELSASRGCYISSSYKESFGMTVIEAMNSNCPMVLSDIPVFREVAGDGALYFEPDNYEKCIGEIYSICEDNELRKDKTNILSERFMANYDGKRVCQEYLDIINGIKQAYIPQNIEIMQPQKAFGKLSNSGRLVSKSVSLSSGKMVESDGTMQLL